MACTDARPDAAFTHTNPDVTFTAFIARRFSQSLRRDGFARFTSFVSYASVALGCFAIVVAMSILNGYERAIYAAMTRFASPIEVRSLLSTTMLDADDVASSLSRIDGVSRASVMVTREALGRTREGVEGLLLIGSSVNQAQRDIAPMLVRGELPPFQQETMPSAVIGSDAARRLGLDLGDTLVIYTGDASLTVPTVLAVVVAGIARSGMQQYDETAVFLDVEALRSRLRLNNGEGSYVAVYPPPDADVTDVAQQIRSSLAQSSGLYVQTYHDRFSAIESWIALQKEPIPIILGLISLVAIATVVATLLIGVVEKTRQIAVLRTMGMTTGGIARIFLWRGIQVGLVGWLAGSTSALVCCLIQDTWHVIALDGNLYYVSSLPVSITATPYIVVAVTSLVTSLLASLAPIVIASRIHPARTLQFR